MPDSPAGQLQSRNEAHEQRIQNAFQTLRLELLSRNQDWRTVTTGMPIANRQMTQWVFHYPGRSLLGKLEHEQWDGSSPLTNTPHVQSQWRIRLWVQFVPNQLPDDALDQDVVETGFVLVTHAWAGTGEVLVAGRPTQRANYRPDSALAVLGRIITAWETRLDEHFEHLELEALPIPDSFHGDTAFWRSFPFERLGLTAGYRAD